MWRDIVGADPDCPFCVPHTLHHLPCESCDCVTSAVGAAWNHEYSEE